MRICKSVSRLASRWSAALASLTLLACLGCGPAPTPRFVLNLEGPERADVPRDKQQGIVDSLVAMFGTPDEPYVFPEAGLDLKKLQLAAGPAWSDETGVRYGLYRKNCAHCHGVTGNGAGPTALFLNPYPRDFRQGKFKFTSTADGIKPTTADLKRTLVHGIPGTAMPSFGLLPDDEVDALVEYVKYLSMRGETEQFVFDLVVNADEKLPLTREQLDEQLQVTVGLWNLADENIVIPQPRTTPVDTSEQLAASIEAGHKLFLGAKAQCLKCHGPTALGDGGDVLYDDWNAPKKGFTPAEVARYWPLPIQELKPRNLRLGIYRGGRRPLDLYRRIFAGIKGANMPAAGERPGDPPGTKLSSEETWHLVDYVLSLPYEPVLFKPVEQTTAHLSTH